MKFIDAQKKMIENLESDEFKEREDAQTTLKSIPILQSIIRGGIITTGSQEGLILNGYNPDSKRYYHIEERAFVDGFMKHVHAVEFIKWINTHTDKLAIMIRKEGSAEFEKEFWSKDLTKIPRIPVTVSGSTLRKGGKLELHADTNIFTVMDTKAIEFEQANAHINKSENVDLVVCIDLVYGRKATSARGLYKDILEGLRQTK